MKSRRYMSTRGVVRCFLLLYLFTFLPFSVVAQQRSCRRGTPRPQGMLLHRGASGGQPRQTGGDFYHGNRHQLTVLVAFNDRAFKGNETATIQQWNKILNAENLTEAPFKGSVHDYFLAQSYGDFNVTFDLQYMVVSGNAAKYASTDVDDENSQYLVQDVMEILKTRNIDWSRYDWNGDGFINQLLIIYAGHGMNDYSGSDLIWPHQWWMSERLKDRQQDVYCDPIPVTSGDIQYKVDCYCALSELNRKNDYGSFGTICHEYSHCFGFPDFYYGRGTQVVSGWDLMDSGNYNGNGYCPCGYSAHERMLMGWLTPIKLASETSVTAMPALIDEPRAYIICNDAHSDECYMIENRQQRGWDESLPGSGLIVFHVDYDPTIWHSTLATPNSSSKKRYHIFPANNNTSTSSSYCAKWGYPYLGNDSLTNYSLPAAVLNNKNVDGEKLMSKPITKMAVANGLASFEFMASSATAIYERTIAQGKPVVLYDLGPILIVRDGDGQIRKVMKR